MVTVLPAGSPAEQASEPGSPAAGQLDAGSYHSCAALAGGSVRCWGYGGDGQLGYENMSTIGDDETPGSVGPVDLGPGHTAKAIAAGDVHTCALLDDGTVRCWGYGGDGRLGYGNTNSIGESQAPGAIGPVDLGPGRTAKAISAGGGHTCAVLDDGNVRCWGYGFNGQLGYGNRNSIGDDETPGSVRTVNLGAGHTATALGAGERHTCALLDDGSVRCWGFGVDGELGYANQSNIGDAATRTPDTVGPVNLGAGRTATAISAGDRHTCAVLDDGSVRCWGYGLSGRLGYGDQNAVGDDETPGSVGAVRLGAGRTALAITAGGRHTCARLDDGNVRCWGFGGTGRLGYANTDNVGDNEAVGSVGPLNLGPGRTATAISAGQDHTCALLDDGGARCWGSGANGRLGYCNENNIGDFQSPGAFGPIDIGLPGGGGADCGSSPSVDASPTTVASPTAVAIKRPRAIDPEASRRRGLRNCRAGVARNAKLRRMFVRRGSPRQRAKARDEIDRDATRRHRRCSRLYGRTPGRITGLRVRSSARTRITLGFRAPGTDGSHPPPARRYVVKQSRRPIRSARDFARAQALCKGSCKFSVSRVAAPITLVVTDLLPRTTYYYAVAARDNVSDHHGSRATTRTRTR